MVLEVHTALTHEEVGSLVAIPDHEFRQQAKLERRQAREQRREEKRNDRELKRAIKAFINGR